jgi:hypothetical protein
MSAELNSFSAIRVYLPDYKILLQREVVMPAKAGIQAVLITGHRQPGHQLSLV